MQAFLRKRFRYILGTVLILFVSPPQAIAGVRVAMAEDLEKSQNFLVTTVIYYHKPEGFHVKHIDRSFLKAGQVKNVTVLAVWPLLYHHVSTQALHPAYWADSTESNKAPFLLRTVELPILRPQSWRHLLNSGEPPKGLGGGIIPAMVDRHFSWILSFYLPAFDRVRIQEDLRQYLPLLRELAAFAHREGVYEKRPMAVKPSQGPIPVQEQGKPQTAILEHYRREMDERLEEIEGWLALEQNKRAPLHDWMAHFHKADYVYQEMMTDEDRTQLLQWLDRSFEGTSGPSLQWTNSANGLGFSADRGYSGGEGAQGFSYSITLSVDLNPILGLKNNRRYLQKSFSRFYRIEKGKWKMG
jgi:hypothetical protein